MITTGWNKLDTLRQFIHWLHCGTCEIGFTGLFIYMYRFSISNFNSTPALKMLQHGVTRLVRKRNRSSTKFI